MNEFIPDSRITIAAPKQPHLALVVDELGGVMPIPVGAQMYIIEDPANPNKIHPLVLVKVTHKAITFRCACKQKGCTRQMQYQLKVTGFHPSQK